MGWAIVVAHVDTSRRLPIRAVERTRDLDFPVVHFHVEVPEDVMRFDGGMKTLDPLLDPASIRLLPQNVMEGFSLEVTHSAYRFRIASMISSSFSVVIPIPDDPLKMSML